MEITLISMLCMTGISNVIYHAQAQSRLLKVSLWGAFVT